MIIDTPRPQRFFLGELLLKEGLISREQLQQALEIQQRHQSYRPLGQILVSCHFLSPQQLNTFMDVQLGKILLSRKAITREDHDQAFQYKKTHETSLGQALLFLKCITEETLKQATATQLNIEFVDPDKITLDPRMADLMTFNYATKHKVCPIGRAKNRLIIVMDDPTNRRIIDDIAAFTDLGVTVVTATTASITRAIHRLFRITTDDSTNCAVLNFGEEALTATDTGELTIDENFQFPEKGISS